MDSYPYMSNPAKVRTLLGEIQRLGVPVKVDPGYLSSIGFSATGDRRLIAIMRSLAFLDESGVPTQRWKRYRDKQIAGGELAKAVREAYESLFKTYPNADQEDRATLKNFFARQADVGEITSNYMARTFEILCRMADFEAIPEEPAEAPEVRERAPAAVVERPVTVTTPQAVPLSIALNIQIVLPATDDASIYDALFAALKKHLLS